MTTKSKRLELHLACKDAISTVENSLLGNEFTNVALFLHRRLSDSLQTWTDEQVDNLHKAFLEKPEEEEPPAPPKPIKKRIRK